MEFIRIKLNANYPAVAILYNSLERINKPMNKHPLRIWLSRLLIALVFGINIECALLFLVTPEKFVSGFELSKITGIVVIQALGILFIMWNVPYFVALLHPLKYRLSLIEACVMQFIGVTGESFLLMRIPSGRVSLREALGRFVLFDSAGLLLFVYSRSRTPNPPDRLAAIASDGSGRPGGVKTIIWNFFINAKYYLKVIY